MVDNRKNNQAIYYNLDWNAHQFENQVSYYKLMTK